MRIISLLRNFLVVVLDSFIFMGLREAVQFIKDKAFAIIAEWHDSFSRRMQRDKGT
jgi:hypothetical protein